uniref:Uncharacterized protein n=1 Tax=Rhizophora mucronata TaxID=61149 RepID=A0A2P2PBG3_RHIMU
MLHCHFHYTSMVIRYTFLIYIINYYNT